MTIQQLIRLLKQGRQGAKQLHAIDLVIDKSLMMVVQTEYVSFQEKINIELAKIDATESEVKAFLASCNRLRQLANKFTSVAGKVKRLAQLAKNNTRQQTSLQGATNRILFAHFSRDNTSQIDSLVAQGV